MTTLRTPDLEAAVDAILSRAGERVVCGTPLGLGKPVPLLNALYARVKAQTRLRLSIITALSLEVPRAASELERRFLEPYVRRAFAGVPELDYMRDLRAGGLPANVELSEFYFRPGAMLGVPAAQQSYISSNYTHVARDMHARGVNAVLVMVAERGGRYSLSCNPDLTLDVVRAMRAGTSGERQAARPCVVAGLVNRNLPFMLHDAEVGEDYFDVLVDAPRWEHPLFGVPNPAAEPVDHAIGIHAAALVKDGGTLQLGIGSLGDAVAHWLRLRHTDPGSFAAALETLDLDRHALVDHEGGRGRFGEGLFASSEMFTWGLMTLYRAGVIRRRANGVDGPLLQGAFFLGPSEFYRALHELPEDERRLIEMTSVSRINDLYGEESLDRRQRRDARFINICMKATLFGAAVSDGLEDGRVVSGVGGQYNFVAMAHELEGARSILLLRATRESGGRAESNIVFNYGHETIPRHLRDVVVTQYGIADLRGRTDAEVAAALIAIADRRFQSGLAERAKAVGKLPRDWRVPEHALGNTEERLAASLAPLAQRGLLPMFPLGTDFDANEQRLVPALLWLVKNASGWRNGLALAGALIGARPQPQDVPALARMGLAKPRGIRERLLRRVVALALSKLRPIAMKSQMQNPFALFLTAFAAALLVCGAETISAAEEDFTALVKRLRQQKPAFAKRHRELLAERYDLADRTAQGVTMSRGKPVQEGVRVRLPKDMTWEKLAAMSPEETKEKQLWPAGFLPLPHPHHEAGGMIFPKFLIEETKKQTDRDLTRFDLDFDLPDHFLPEFPAPIYLTTRPDLGDASQGKLVTLSNFNELFKDILNPKQLEGLRLLVTPFPQQQFNATEERRSLKAHQGVACFDCHSNGHTNASTHTAGDARPNEHRHRIDTPSLRGVNVQRLFGSQRALKSVEDFTEFEQRGAYFDGIPADATRKGTNVLERGSQVHFMAEFQALLDFPPAPKLNVFGKLNPAKASESEMRGQEIFFGKGQCATCHTPPYYTDNLMHNLKVERFFKEVTINGRKASADGPIKTFPLRGIKDSPPYLHDDRLLTLEDTVEFFNLVLELKLSAQEKKDLLTFLRVL